jgi:hypothetical protein
MPRTHDAGLVVRAASTEIKNACPPGLAKLSYAHPRIHSALSVSYLPPPLWETYKGLLGTASV